MSVTDDLRDYLTTGGIATTIYTRYLPERPDDAIQITVTGGYPPVHAFSAVAGAAVQEQPTVQIIRRSQVQERAEAEMNVIWRMLDGLGDRVINGTKYYWISAFGSPFTLPQDLTQRNLVVCNFLVVKAVSTATST